MAKLYFRSMQGEPLSFFTHDLITGIFLLWSVLFMALWLNYRKRLRAVFTNFVSQQYQNFYGRDERLLFNPFNMIAGVMFFLATSLFIYLALLRFGPSLPYLGEMPQFPVVVLWVLAFYVIKSFIAWSIGWAVKKLAEARLFLFGRYAFLQVISMIVMLFMGLYFFLPALNDWFFYAGLALGALLFVWYTIRLALRALQSRWLSLKYIFLYICAFEIAPLIIVYFKVVK